MREVVLFGPGKFAKDHWEELRKEYNPVCFPGSNEKRWGETYLGLPVLSPREVQRKYENAEFYVSLQNGAWGRRLAAIDELVHRYGIDKSRILNYQDYYYGWGCPYAQGSLFFQHDRLQLCCENPTFPSVPFTNFQQSPEQSLRKVVDLKRRSLLRIKSMDEKAGYEAKKDETSLYAKHGGAWVYSPREMAAEGENIACWHCENKKYGFFTDERFEIESMQISLNSDSRCNFKCPYCCEAMPGYAPKHDPQITRNIVSVLHALYEAKGELTLKKDPFICISFGEPALHPDLEEIISAIPAYYQILTNASVYSEVIQKAIGHGEIVTSLDSGTPETFQRIKGIDCFDRVQRNLLRYREFGAVIPKYIIMQGVNDSEADADGFIEFCKRLQPPRVEIVRDYLEDGFDYDRFTWPESTMRFAARLVRKLDDEGFNTVYTVFPDDFRTALREYEPSL